MAIIPLVHLDGDQITRINQPPSKLNNKSIDKLATAIDVASHFIDTLEGGSRTGDYTVEIRDHAGELVWARTKETKWE